MNEVIRQLLIAAGAFVLAGAVALAVTPRLIDAALRFGIVDRPDGELKTQRRSVPYLGGLAVALGVLVSVGAVYRFDRQVLALLLGASIVLVLGLLDDLGSLSPWSKLAGQLLAVLVLIRAGISLQLVFLPWWLCLPLTVLWMLAATNAFNLIDVMDGLSSGVGAVAALFLAGIALMTGQPDSGFLAAALAGALVGFRHYNVEPARIYLGDTGSLFVGFLLGALAFVNHYTVVHRAGALAPLLILGVPLFDMLFVMYIRWRRGLPVMLGSPDHVALRLRKWKLSTRNTVRANVSISIVLGLWALGVMLAPLWWSLALVAALVVLALAAAAWLKTIDMGL